MNNLKTHITIDAGLHNAVIMTVGAENVDIWVENTVRNALFTSTPMHDNWPSDNELASAYKAMASDTKRENEAHEWCNAMIGDATAEEDNVSR